jgi:hypothetical protein
MATIFIKRIPSETSPHQTETLKYLHASYEMKIFSRCKIPGLVEAESIYYIVKENMVNSFSAIESLDINFDDAKITVSPENGVFIQVVLFN